MSVSVVICGGRKFRDQKLLHRALDAFHKKHRISRLITGELAGTEEMAYFWAVSKRIPEIITMPATADLLGRISVQRRNMDMLQMHQPFAVIVFPPCDESGPRHMIEAARQFSYKVWEVPATWR